MRRGKYKYKRYRMNEWTHVIYMMLKLGKLTTNIYFAGYHGIGKRRSVIYLRCYFNRSQYVLAFCVPFRVFVKWLDRAGYL